MILILRSPVCILMCLVSSSVLQNLLRQPSTGHACGRVCLVCRVGVIFRGVGTRFFNEDCFVVEGSSVELLLLFVDDELFA